MLFQYFFPVSVGLPVMAAADHLRQFSPSLKLPSPIAVLTHAELLTLLELPKNESSSLSLLTTTKSTGFQNAVTLSAVIQDLLDLVPLHLDRADQRSRTTNMKALLRMTCWPLPRVAMVNSDATRTVSLIFFFLICLFNLISTKWGGIEWTKNQLFSNLFYFILFWYSMHGSRQGLW